MTDLILPKGSEKTDWEVELAVVIGKKATYVSEEEALEYVAGYCLHNDYSERAFQLERAGQWVKGKSCDTFAPLGPYLVTKDEIQGCPQAAALADAQRGNPAGWHFCRPDLSDPVSGQLHQPVYVIAAR